MYQILCTVSGGVTGTRQSFLKNGGVVVTYDTYEEARDEAERLENARMSNVNRTCDFTYIPVEM